MHVPQMFIELDCEFWSIRGQDCIGTPKIKGPFSLHGYSSSFLSFLLTFILLFFLFFFPPAVNYLPSLDLLAIAYVILSVLLNEGLSGLGGLW